MAFWLPLIIGIALTVLGYLLMPKPKMPSMEVKDMEDPTAEAGRPLPVPFGRITIKGTNVLYFGDKYYNKYKVRA